MNFLLGLLFSASSMLFWGGAYTLFAINYVYRKYKWVVLIVVLAFVAGIYV